MGPQGVYQHDYSQLGPSRKADFRIIPCTRQNFLQNSERSEICSPVKCYSDRACSVMCYPIIDPDLDSRELYATMFQLSRAPPPDAVLEQLVVLIQMAKKMLESVDGKNLGTRKELSDRVIASFSGIFQYLSSRTSEFHKSSLDSLRSVAFIPVGSGETGLLDWYKPEQVFFKSSNTDTSERDSLTELLFKAVDYSSFLSAVGVKEEASARCVIELYGPLWKVKRVSQLTFFAPFENSQGSFPSPVVISGIHIRYLGGERIPHVVTTHSSQPAVYAGFRAD